MDKFKELWGNQRYNALIRLCVGFIFMLIVIIMIRTSSNTPSNPQKPKLEVVVDAVTKYTNMQNYEFEIKYNNQIVTGQRFRSNICFYKDTQYCYNDLSKIELEQVYKYMPNDIMAFVNSGVLSTKNENFDEKSIESKYNIDDELISSITLYEKDNGIYKVLITYKDNNILEYNYSNIGHVEAFIIEG